MKHVTYSDKSLMMSDQAADMLLAYASVLADGGNADTVTLKAIGATGENVSATFLLDAGSNLMAETVDSTLPEPDNRDAIDYMRTAIQLRVDPPEAAPQPAEELSARASGDDY